MDYWSHMGLFSPVCWPGWFVDEDHTEDYTCQPCPAQSAISIKIPNPKNPCFALLLCFAVKHIMRYWCDFMVSSGPDPVFSCISLLDTSGIGVSSRVSGGIRDSCLCFVWHRRVLEVSSTQNLNCSLTCFGKLSKYVGLGMTHKIKSTNFQWLNCDFFSGK